nr:TOMM precursor leader peptide-binding protein [Bowmanella dokdonensis]
MPIGILAAAGCDTLLETVKGLLRETNRQTAQVASLEDRHLNPATAGLWLVLADSRGDMDRVLTWQQRCREAQVPLLLVSQSPGLINLGPLVRPGQDACIGCWKKWVDNNHRLPQISRSGQPDRQIQAQLPLTPMAADLFKTLLLQVLTQAVGKPESLHATYWRLRLRELASSRHTYNALCECPHCDNDKPDSEQNAQIHFRPRLKRHVVDKRVPNPRLSLEGVRRQFVDRHSGLIKHLYQSISSSLMPMYTAEMQLMDSEDFESGYGRAETAQKSELVAILEGIERFAGYSPKRTRTQVRGSYRTIRAAYPGRCVDPQDFILHDPALRNPRFALLDYHPDLEFNWCWGYSFRQQAPVLIPEQLVYYRLEGTEAAPVNRFVYDSSNGCAMGGCLEEAILCGLFEVVERDAYLTTWYSRLVPDRIDNASIREGRVQALIARAQAEGFEIYLFDMALDIPIPAVWAMIVDPADDAPVKSYCASAAHSQWHEAIFSALVEVVTSMGVYRQSMPGQRAKALQMVDDHDQVEHMPDHVLLYSAPETYPRLEFLHQGPLLSLAECEARLPSLYHQDLNQELHIQADKVLNVASDLIVVQQSFSKMEDNGLHCVKVLAPGLMPVTFGHQYRRISYPRLDSAARARGQWAAHFNAERINPFPHNFP